jgi:hypothetical protein
VVTFVMAAGEVSYSIRGDEQPVGARGGASKLFCPTVLAELLIQIALVAVSHALHDGVSPEKCRVGSSIVLPDSESLLNIRS